MNYRVGIQIEVLVCSYLLAMNTLLFSQSCLLLPSWLLLCQQLSGGHDYTLTVSAGHHYTLTVSAGHHYTLTVSGFLQNLAGFFLERGKLGNNVP